MPAHLTDLLTVSHVFSWGLPGSGGLFPWWGMVPLFTLNLSLQLQSQAVCQFCDCTLKGMGIAFPW